MDLPLFVLLWSCMLCQNLIDRSYLIGCLHQMLHSCGPACPRSFLPAGSSLCMHPDPWHADWSLQLITVILLTLLSQSMQWLCLSGTCAARWSGCACALARHFLHHQILVLVCLVTGVLTDQALLQYCVHNRAVQTCACALAYLVLRDTECRKTVCHVNVVDSRRLPASSTNKHDEKISWQVNF